MCILMSLHKQHTSTQNLQYYQYSEAYFGSLRSLVILSSSPMVLLPDLQNFRPVLPASVVYINETWLGFLNFEVNLRIKIIDVFFSEGCLQI